MEMSSTTNKAAKRKRSPQPTNTTAIAAAAVDDPNAIKSAGYILELDAPVEHLFNIII
jgi:hypothetical protein